MGRRHYMQQERTTKIVCPVKKQAAMESLLFLSAISCVSTRSLEHDWSKRALSIKSTYDTDWLLFIPLKL